MWERSQTFPFREVRAGIYFYLIQHPAIRPEREGEIEREGGTGVRCLAGSQPDRHQAPGPWKKLRLDKTKQLSLIPQGPES